MKHASQLLLGNIIQLHFPLLHSPDTGIVLPVSLLSVLEDAVIANLKVFEAIK